MFIPWEVLGIDTSRGVPKEFRVLPGYRAQLGGQSETSLLKSLNYSINATTDYYRFDHNGYVTADREGAVIGDSIFGNAKSGNWDISKEASGIVRSAYGTEHH